MITNSLLATIAISIAFEEQNQNTMAAILAHVNEAGRVNGLETSSSETLLVVGRHIMRLTEDYKDWHKSSYSEARDKLLIRAYISALGAAQSWAKDENVPFINPDLIFEILIQWEKQA